jgi:hypothetical protein
MQPPTALAALSLFIVASFWLLLDPSGRDAAAGGAEPPRPVGSALRVSENGRYLVGPEGKPFFWLGDTAWLLFQMTTR